MKRLVLAISIVLLFLSCQPDPYYNELPKTNVNNYISGNIVLFPENTTIWHIYNVIYHLHPDSDYYNVTNGKINKDDSIINFNRIRHFSSIDINGSNSNNVSFYYDSSLIKNYSYTWNELLPNQVTAVSPVSDASITFSIE